MNKKTLTILGIVLLVVIAGSFWFVKNSSEQKIKNNVIPTKVEESTSSVDGSQNVQNTNTQNDVIASDNEAISENEQQIENEDILYNPDGTIDTSNWKTYTNEEYGFRFKYPSHLEVQEYVLGEYKDSIFTVLLRNENSGSILVKVKNEPFNLEKVEGIHGSLINENEIRTEIFNELTMYVYKTGDAGCFGDIISIPNEKLTLVMSMIDCVDVKYRIIPLEKAVLDSLYFFEKE